MFGAGLAALVVLTGLVATYVVENLILGTPRADPAFISTLLIDVLNFASLATAGLLLRGDAAAHKRLMLLATMSLLQAGIVRWWGPALKASFGTGFLGGWMADYLGVSLLVLGLGIYDLVTRRAAEGSPLGREGRFHPRGLVDDRAARATGERALRPARKLQWTDCYRIYDIECLNAESPEGYCSVKRNLQCTFAIFGNQ